MKKHSYWKTIYFDGFAGNGNRNTKCESPVFQQLFISENEESVYKGAAERVLNLPNNLSFDFHYFIDLKKESLNQLKTRLDPFQIKYQNQSQYKSGDCNQWLLKLSETMKKSSNKYAALVLLDPFGMQIRWDSIASLKDTRSDIWILIPTGVIVNRLLDSKCELKSIKKLTSFFGLSEEEIKNYFYKKENHSTLFGEEEIIKKVNDPIKKISKIYVDQLKTIWKYVTEKPMKLINSKNVPIFHFVFASNNQNAVKIAKQIITTI